MRDPDPVEIILELSRSRARTLRVSWPTVTHGLHMHYSRLWVWLIGVANTKATIVALIAIAV